MNHTYNHPQGHISGAFRPRLTPTQPQSADPSAAIIALFSGGQPGVWYDPSDFSAMFQGLYSSVPVTAVTQPVGLILDKRLGLALGSETFGSPTDYAGSANVVVAGDLVTVTCTVNGVYGVKASTNLVVGGTVYRVSFELVTNSASRSIAIFPNLAGDAAMVSTPGTYSLTQYASAASGTSANLTFIVFGGVAGESFSLRAVSIKPIAGNHATQATAAARPVLRQDGGGKYYLEFDGVDDFLSTAAIDFSATDEISSLVAIERANTTTSMVVELSENVNTNSGSFYIVSGADIGDSYTVKARGDGLGAFGHRNDGPVPERALLAILADLSDDSAALRWNGADQLTTAGDCGSGNFGNYPIYLGSRGGIALRFAGNIYQNVIIGRVVTTDELANAEAYIANKSGVAL